MGPSRKRPRTKPPITEEPPDTNPPLDQASSAVAGPSTAARPATNTGEGENDVKGKDKNAPALLQGKKSEANISKSKQLKARSSWYGTWPRKAIPSTQVARESILADNPANGGLTADLSRFEPKKSPVISASRPPSMILGKSKETLDITMGGTLENEGKPDTEPQPNQASSNDNTPAVDTTPPPEEPSSQPETQPLLEAASKPATPTASAGWFGGWLGRPAIQPPTIPEEQNPENTESSSIPEPEAPPPPVRLEEPVPPKSSANSSSWFGLWSSSAPVTPGASEGQIPVKIAEDNQDTVMEDASALDKTPQPPAQPVSQPATGSSWAFWSTDTPKKTTDSISMAESHGQLAITGEASQDNPEPAKTTPLKDNKKTKSSKRSRPKSVDLDEATRKTVEVESSQADSSRSSTPPKQSPPNLLIPSVRSTYRLVENPSILQQIARLLFHGNQKPVKHVFLAKEPPKIKKALAIGIHGLFPAPLLRTVIGQPTGTSIRFANHAAASIRRWADKTGSTDCEIEKVALEGEGKIGERVDNLWKLLLNWVTHIKHADFILVACHSQGVPVALMLIAKLIEFGVVSSGRIGVCAMAGVSLGPFPDYKSRLFSGSAGELFDFANPESVVSKRYEESLRVAVKYGVRITYCGSIDDQLVSMESSIFSPAEHPYIYRAVFVDGRIHAPDFLSHLVGFALKLRNLGVSDHGLIRELSAPLAGSLYTGEGHSRLYDDGNVYDLAVEYALETTSVGDVPLNLKKYEIPTNANPYVLPWIMRGLLEEDFVKTDLDHETTELLKKFDDWKPATKVLKDVKYRLEAVRSKL